MRCTKQHGDVDMRSRDGAVVQRVLLAHRRARWASTGSTATPRDVRSRPSAPASASTARRAASSRRAQWYEEHYGRYPNGLHAQHGHRPGQHARDAACSWRSRTPRSPTAEPSMRPSSSSASRRPTAAVMEELTPHVRRRLDVDPPSTLAFNARVAASASSTTLRAPRSARMHRGRRHHQPARRARPQVAPGSHAARRRRAARLVLLGSRTLGSRAIAPADDPHGGHRRPGGARWCRRSKRRPHRHAHPAGVPGGHHRPAGASPA
jgi:hypothetical protein